LVIAKYTRFTRITSRLSSCNYIAVETYAFESGASYQRDSCMFRFGKERRTRQRYRGMVNGNIHWHFSKFCSYGVPTRAEWP